jgi:hypothetical protein
MTSTLPAMGSFRRKRLEHANQVFVRVVLVASVVCLLAVILTPSAPIADQTQFWQKRNLVTLQDVDVSTHFSQTSIKALMCTISVMRSTMFKTNAHSYEPIATMKNLVTSPTYNSITAQWPARNGQLSS